MGKQLALALECSIFNENWTRNRHLCVNCPYGYGKQRKDDDGESYWYCDDLEMLHDAVEIVRQQEQHLLTVEEVKEKCNQNEPLWIEDICSGVGSGWTLGSRLPMVDNQIMVYNLKHPKGKFLDLKNYGKTWRCWKEQLINGRRDN